MFLIADHVECIVRIQKAESTKQLNLQGFHTILSSLKMGMILEIKYRLVNWFADCINVETNKLKTQVLLFQCTWIFMYEFNLHLR